ncbi:DUF4169 family protein [Maricaulis sp. D1M11]|uniref:DUF4169 family protein n=1 Tax=Maricaulis sp. D1M11 TaxID=3076117 RepID=UPI0039B6E29F
MTSKPINLRQFRKRKQREDKDKQAEANRVEHGTPKAVRELSAARRAHELTKVEAHKRTPPSQNRSGLKPDAPDSDDA